MLEFGALPPLSVPPPALIPVPAHVPLGKNVYAIDPVGVNDEDEPVTDAVSYADAPVDSVPDQAALAAASNTVVLVADVPVPTVNDSHVLVELPKFESPEVNVASKL